MLWIENARKKCVAGDKMSCSYKGLIMEGS